MDKTPTTIVMSVAPGDIYIWTNGEPSSEVQGETGISAAIRYKIKNTTVRLLVYIDWFKQFEC